MNKEQMRKSGSLAGNWKWTDKELFLSIRGTELALAYLEGRGERLIVKQLRIELNSLRDIERNRRYGD